MKSVNWFCRAKLLCYLIVLGLLILAAAKAGAVDSLEFNRRATATAQVMAGITPAPGDPAIDRLVKLEPFAEHQKWMAAQWAQVRNRMQTIENWRSQEVRIPGAGKKTMLYPFSGPDFLNAYVLFPDHAKYVFFSLERPGGLPDLESITPTQFGRLLQDIRGAFKEIFERNYFITSYMNKQLTTPWLRGSVPVMATMMALMNLRIVRVEPLDLYPELTRQYENPEAERPRLLLRGVRMEFSAGNGSIQQLYYFSFDATDKALKFYPEILNWVGQKGPATTLLKSASYLLHDSQFSKTRAMILESADYLVQDDTGMPYRFINQSPWQVKLYGQYHKPIRPMEYGYQKDLDAAFKAKTQVADLPFPFGYHWKGSQSGLIVASKERNSN
jgi:hypothetical protein